MTAFFRRYELPAGQSVYPLLYRIFDDIKEYAGSMGIKPGRSNN